MTIRLQPAGGFKVYDAIKLETERSEYARLLWESRWQFRSKVGLWGSPCSGQSSLPPPVAPESHSLSSLAVCMIPGRQKTKAQQKITMSVMMSSSRDNTWEIRFVPLLTRKQYQLHEWQIPPCCCTSSVDNKNCLDLLENGTNLWHEELTCPRNLFLVNPTSKNIAITAYDLRSADSCTKCISIANLVNRYMLQV